MNLAPFLNGLAGQIISSSGDQSEAEGLYRRALAVYEKAYGPDDPRLVQQLEALAGYYAWEAPIPYSSCVTTSSASQCAAIRQQTYEKGEPFLLRAVEIEEKHPEQNIPRGTLILPLPSALDSLGRLYMNEGKTALAESTYQQLSTVQSKLYGPGSSEVVSAWLMAGGAYNSQMDYSQAKAYYQLALDAAKQLPAGGTQPGALEVAIVLDSLARVSFEEKKNDEGRAYLQQALNVVTGSESSLTDLQLVVGLQNIAGQYFFERLYDDAQATYLQMIPIEEKNLTNPAVKTLYVQTLRNYADLLRQ